jgi:hypothetical protein
MSTERKKAELKPIVKLEPKQRVNPKSEPSPKPIAKIIEKPIEAVEEEKLKVKRAENKYVRISLEAKQDEKVDIINKVKNGELKWAFYATEGDKGYHHYLVINKTK